MNVNSDQISADDLLDDLEFSGALNNEEKLRAFLCSCCRLIWNKLPKIAQEALIVAEKYNQKSASREQLYNERIKLWQFWQETPDHYNNLTMEAKAVRPVIYCLYEDIQKQEAFDYASGVMDCCNIVENKEREQYELLQEIFKS